MSKTTFCSLFSGIGGFETGIMDALGEENTDVVFASEIDKFASASYTTIYRHEPRGDITAIDAADVPDHDVLVGGFPCQAFSIAGNRSGMTFLCNRCGEEKLVKFDEYIREKFDCACGGVLEPLDERGLLFNEIARIANRKQPKAMLLENVKGLVGHDKGRTLEVIVKTLSDLGYAVDFDIVNSKYHGVPQNRERIFIVALKDVQTEDWKIPEGSNAVSKAKRSIQVLDGIRTFNFPFPQERQAPKTIFDIMEEAVDEKYYMDEGKTIDLIRELEVRAAMNDIPEPKPNEMLMLGRLNMKGNDSIRRVYDPRGIAPTLTTMGGGHREPKIAVEEHHTVIEDGKEKTYRYRIRKLTPLECFRLQGFPDHYYHTLREEKVSDTQLYKMAGNAVTSNVIASIFRNLKDYL